MGRFPDYLVEIAVKELINAYGGLRFSNDRKPLLDQAANEGRIYSGCRVVFEEGRYLDCHGLYFFKYKAQPIKPVELPNPGLVESLPQKGRLFAFVSISVLSCEDG